MFALLIEASIHNRQDSLKEIASICVELYSGPKLSSSSLAAGFILVKKNQESQKDWVVQNRMYGIEQFLSNVPVRKTTKFFDISEPKNSYLLTDLRHYIDYSLTIFGWPYYVVDGPQNLCCLFPYMRFSSCCSKRRRRQLASRKVKQCSTEQTGSGRTNTKNDNLDDQSDLPIVIKDNCLGCNQACVHRRLRDYNYDLIYINYSSDINIIPFLVAVDHAKRTVVVSIRGSMVLSDAVIDMNGKPDVIPLDDSPPDWLVHRGMLKSSCYIRDTLINERLLERAFESRPDLGSQNYELLFCGHSLGAGVSAILGILMYKMYPNLKAYLYSPPGGLLSPPAVEFTKKFATSIFLGNDCVPRLGMIQIRRLNYYIMKCLKDNERSKAKLLAGSVCPSLCCMTSNKTDVGYNPENSPNILFGTNEDQPFEYKNKLVECPDTKNTLYTPGKIIHIVRNHSVGRSGNGFQTSSREPIYQAIWADNYDYDRIVLDDCMFADHLPANLQHAMKMLYSRTLPITKSTKFEVDGYQQQTGPTTIADIQAFINKKHVIEDINNNSSKIDCNNNDRNNNNNNNSNYPNLNNHYETGEYGSEVLYPDMNGNDSNVTDMNNRN